MQQESQRAVRASQPSGADAIGLELEAGPGRSPEGAGPETVPAEWDWPYLYATVRPALLRKITARFPFAAADAEDIVQDVFAEVLRRSPRVRNPASYLLAAVYNSCFDRVRLKSRRRDTGEIDEDSAVDSRSEERLHARCAARGAFRRIDSRCRKLVLRYCIEERTLKETASEAGVTINAVWKRIQQCLRTMSLYFTHAPRGTRRRPISPPSPSGVQ